MLKHLNYIDGVVVSKPIIPILNNFLFDIKNGMLTISSTDLETTMITQIKVDAQEDISIAIPSKNTLELLRKLPDQPLAITITPESNSVEIKYETGKFKTTAINGEEFPKTPEVDAASSFTIPSKILQKAIAKTVFATSSEEIRLNLTGVNVQLFKNSITFVATDANRLVRFTRNDIKPGIEESFILPKKALNLLKSTLPGDDTPVKVEYNRQNAFFTFGDISLICRMIDEKYPDYKAVIPIDNPNKLIVDKNDFSMAVQRVAITSNRSTHQVRVKIAGSELIVSAEDIDYENEAVERLTCNYTGEDMEIGFNSKYLLELLNNVDDEQAVIEMSQPNRAAVVLPLNQQPDEDILMLVMPMMISSSY